MASSCSFDKSLTLQVLPKDKLMVTPRGIQFKVPGILPPQEVITISIGMNDILKVKKGESLVRNGRVYRENY